MFVDSVYAILLFESHFVDQNHILAGESSLDGTSIKTFSCSALVILLTIHAQDFPDINGDRKSGRRTLPIVAPEASRVYMLCVLPLLSLTLTSVWSLGPLCSIFFVSIGSWVGLRYFLFRDEIRDQSSYRLYNVRILSCCLVCDLTFVVPCRYGSWAFISCLRTDVSLCWHGSFALLRRDHGFWRSLGVYPWL